jgi:hypothetical protein
MIRTLKTSRRKEEQLTKVQEARELQEQLMPLLIKELPLQEQGRREASHRITQKTLEMHRTKCRMSLTHSLANYYLSK